MLIRPIVVAMTLICFNNSFAQTTDCPPAKVSFSDYKELVAEVDVHRGSRLIDLDTFLKMSKEPGVVVLDARSDFRFERIHVKGAKHLTFTEFTQDKLASVIPSTSTKILIYCNNNFEGDQRNFALKADITSVPDTKPTELSTIRTLALNIPTYITLYGYGYQNVYELSEYVKVSDPRIEFEGTEVRPIPVPVLKARQETKK